MSWAFLVTSKDLIVQYLPNIGKKLIEMLSDLEAVFYKAVLD